MVNVLIIFYIWPGSAQPFGKNLSNMQGRKICSNTFGLLEPVYIEPQPPEVVLISEPFGYCVVP